MSPAPTITLTPNVGTPVVMTAVVSALASSGAAPTGIYQAVLGSDADTATAWTITVVYGSNPFGGSAAGLWAIPSASLNSTTPTGSSSGSSSSGNSCSTTLNVSAGGFVIAAGASADASSANLGVIAASGSTAQRSQIANIVSRIAADASNLSASASSSVSITFPNTAATRISAVAYR